MKITLMTAGTRGDVQPFVALARGLQGAGHDVLLATGAKYETFVTGYGVPFRPISNEYHEFIISPEIRQVYQGNVARKLRATEFPLLRRLLDDCWEAAQGAEALIYLINIPHAVHIAEKLNVPCFVAAHSPALSPTKAFPDLHMTRRNLGGFLNKLSYLAIRPLNLRYYHLVSEWRSQVLGLPKRNPLADDYKLHGRPVPALYFYSPLLVPTPDDWDASITVTGFWPLEDREEYVPPDDLVAFLESGPPPVYVGFGSMATLDPEAMAQTVIGALVKAGQRGVVAAECGAIAASDAPDSVYLAKAIPHPWLFPRMRAVIHQGGAGTLASALLAGKPMAVCPFFYEQPFWGKVVHDVGIGAPPIPQERLTVDNLAEMIRVTATDTAMRERAEALGAQVRAEDGVARAVKAIEQSLDIRT